MRITRDTCMYGLGAALALQCECADLVFECTIIIAEVHPCTLLGGSHKRNLVIYVDVTRYAEDAEVS